MATLYWGPALVGGSSTGTWNNSTLTNWFTDAARTIQAAAAPTTADDVIFDAASAAAPFTVTLSTSAACRNVTISGLSAAMTLAGTTAWTVAGSLSFPATNLTRTYTGTITFSSTTTGNTITTNGVTLANNLTFDGVGGYWTLGSALTTTGTTVTLTNGTLDLGSFVLTCVLFASSSTNVRTLAFNTGKIVLTGNANTIWNVQSGTNFAVSGTRTVECSYAGATGIRLFNHGSNPAASITESSAVDVTVLGGGTDTFAFSISAGRSAVRNFTATAFSGTLGNSGSGNQNAPPQVFGNVALSGTLNMTGLTSANGWYFSGTLSTQTVNFGGVSTPASITVATAAGTGVQLVTNGLTTTSTVSFTGGTLDLNSLTLTSGAWSISGATAKVLAFGTNGKIVCSGTGAAAWNNTVTNMTTSGTGSISMTGATAKTFTAGTNAVYTCSLDQGGAGALTIASNCTFANITNSYSATGATTITLSSSTTKTLTAGCSLAGAAGNVLTLNTSTPGTVATIVCSALSATMSYVTVSDIVARGGCRYYAFPGSTNSGTNNKGLVFSRAALRGGMSGFMGAI